MAIATYLGGYKQKIDSLLEERHHHKDEITSLKTEVISQKQHIIEIIEILDN